MRFDRNSRGNPYLNRRDQSRLLRLVGLMALVLIAFRVARQPSSWEWFVQLSESGAASAPTESPARLRTIQIHRPAIGPELSADDVYARVDDATPPAGEFDQPVEAAASEPVPEGEQAWSLPPHMLDGVVDDWFGLTRAEQPALGRIAAHLASPAAASLVQAADSQVTFEGLLGNPDYYRGRPVTVRGRLRRCTRGRIGNGDAVCEVWEAWIIPPDSRQTPYLVYALNAPADMPIGETLDETVAVSGVFVRRFAYAAAGGEAITALLMTPALTWSPALPPAPQQLKRDLQWTTLVFVGLIGVILLGAGGWYLFSDRRYRRSRLHAIGESRLDAAAEDLRRLEDFDGGDPHIIRVSEPASTPGG